jgi:hypothetical protein
MGSPDETNVQSGLVASLVQPFTWWPLNKIRGFNVRLARHQPTGNLQAARAVGSFHAGFLPRLLSSLLPFTRNHQLFACFREDAAGLVRELLSSPVRDIDI